MAEAPPFPTDEFFLLCLREAASEPELVREFDRLWGTNLQRRGGGIELAIDHACGRSESDVRAFAEFVRDYVYEPLMRAP